MSILRGRSLDNGEGLTFKSRLEQVQSFVPVLAAAQLAAHHRLQLLHPHASTSGLSSRLRRNNAFRNSNTRYL